MTGLRYDLQTLGFLARTSQLRELGHTRREIDAAIAEGWLARPARPWVATSSAERDAVIAVLHRGRLTGASALGSLGVWRGLDRAIHVLVRPHASGVVSRSAVPLAEFAQPRHPTRGVVRHWGIEHARLPGQPEWRASAVDALAAFARHSDADDLVAGIDSALHTGVLRPIDVPLLSALLPQRLQGALRLVDGRAESGTESLARLRLARLHCSIEPQVEIGPYRVDLLLDGWLAIEIDSEEWHGTQRVEDARKSAWLTARDYRVERFDYQQVLFEWPTVEAAVRAALARPSPDRPRPAPRSARR